MVQQPHGELALTAISTVQTGPAVTPAAAGTPPWETVSKRLATPRQPEELEASQFLFASPLITINPAILAYARLFLSPRNTGARRRR